MSSSQKQQGLSKRLKEPSSSSSSLARTDTIKAGYFDGEGAEKERGAATGVAPAPAAGKAPLESSPGKALPSPSSSSSSSPPPLSRAEAAARLAALSAELERLQKNQAVLNDALARGRAVLVAPSASAAASSSAAHRRDDIDDVGDGHHPHHSTLTGALADPPLVDPSPGAQAAHKKKLRRQEARARGGRSSSKFVSAGLCGFEVADDLLRFDFAAAASADGGGGGGGGDTSANTEFRAPAFDQPQAKQTLRSLRSQAAELLPAGDPKLASFLKQLEAQQRWIIKMMLAENGGAGGGKLGTGDNNGGDSSSLIPASLVLSPLLKNPLARLAEAGMTVADDEGTAEMGR